MSVTYGLADFTTGRILPTLPVTEGCSWAAILGKPDALEARLVVTDPDVRALNVMSITEPKKTVLFAAISGSRGTFLAAGLIAERGLEDDDVTFTVRATGLRYYWHQRIIGRPEAKSSNLTNADGSANTALDVTLSGLSLAGIGVELMRTALSWPGATSIPFVLPASEKGAATRSYAFLDTKLVGEALDDLTNVIDGPDFAVEARRVNGTSTSRIEYPVRAGDQGDPMIGRYVGSWPYGGPVSPVVSFPFVDDGEALVTAQWAIAGRTDSKVLASRALNDNLLSFGYPPLDAVDMEHSDVSVQSTLDDYAREGAYRGYVVDRSYTLKVRGDTRIDGEGAMSSSAPSLGPMLGDYRPGDFVAVDIVDHPVLPDGIVDLRILSMQGDETGDVVELDVMVVR